MALQSMTALASITLQEASTSVTFSGIPQNYRDLVLVIDAQLSANGGGSIRLNADSGTNYSQVMMLGQSVVESGSETAAQFYGNWSNGLSGTKYMLIFQLFDYSVTDKHKNIIMRSGYTNTNSNTFSETKVGRWSNTAAVNSITLPNNTFATGSTLSLYGRIA
jgi:hypothetical protein